MSPGRAERYALAVDLGTGGPKVGLVSLTGTVAWSDHIPVATRMLPGGGAVQDAGRVVDADQRRRHAGPWPPGWSTRPRWWPSPDRPVGQHRPRRRRTAGRWATACSGWTPEGGPHTRRAVGGPVSGYAPRALWRSVRRSGGAPSTSGADPVGHILYLENEEPEVARAARWYLEPVDYLAARFTGIVAASHASMTASWLTDNRHLDRLAYDRALVRAVGVPAEKLPPLVPTASVVGEVTPAVAAELGLPARVRLVAGTPDLHSAAVGAGAVLDYQAHLAISTTSWISCPVPKKKTDAVRQIAAVPGLSPGRYLIADNHETGGLCLQWLRDNLLVAAPMRPRRPSTP